MEPMTTAASPTTSSSETAENGGSSLDDTPSIAYEAYYCEARKREFYYNPASKTVQWHAPNVSLAMVEDASPVPSSPTANGGDGNGVILLDRFDGDDEEELLVEEEMDRRPSSPKHPSSKPRWLLFGVAVFFVGVLLSRSSSNNTKSGSKAEVRPNVPPGEAFKPVASPEEDHVPAEHALDDDTKPVTSLIAEQHKQQQHEGGDKYTTTDSITEEEEEEASSEHQDDSLEEEAEPQQGAQVEEERVTEEEDDTGNSELSEEAETPTLVQQQQQDNVEEAASSAETLNKEEDLASEAKTDPSTKPDQDGAESEPQDAAGAAAATLTSETNNNNNSASSPNDPSNKQQQQQRKPKNKKKMDNMYECEPEVSWERDVVLPVEITKNGYDHNTAELTESILTRIQSEMKVDDEETGGGGGEEEEIADNDDKLGIDGTLCRLPWSQRLFPQKCKEYKFESLDSFIPDE